MKIKLKGYNPAPPIASTSALPSPAPVPPQARPSPQVPQLYPHLQPGPPPGSVNPAQLSLRNDGPFASQQRFPVDGAGQHQSQTTGQPGSPSGSSRASDDFLNAPLPLPDSSGDEYEEDEFGEDGSVRTGARRKHFDSQSPRPRRSQTGGSVEPPQFFELLQMKHRQQQPSDGTKKPRGRPPKGKEKDRDGAFRVRLWDPNKGKARASADVEGDDSMDVDEGGSQADFDEEGGQNTSTNESRDVSQTPASGASTPNMFYSDGKKRIGTPTGRNDRQKTAKTKGNGLAPDEANLPIDEEGEKKVDAAGNLLGGREYKASTFVSKTKKNAGKVYMLAIDAARCAGFRDSLYFFRRNPWINKINCSQEEKEILINSGRLHTNLKSRQVTIVAAGNCFKVFGARFVKNGKNVTDDYYEAAALAKGLVPGSPAYSESYDPEIDNTTLAMPKVGGFAAKRGPGRPAYMKIAEAFEMAGATPAMTPDAQSKFPLPVPKPSKDGGAESSDEDDGKGGRRRKKGWRFRKDKQSPYHLLRIPKSYNATVFGTVGGQATPQYGGNGQAPFGEQWEKSKARKPAPHMNGYNWMSEYAKITRERNRAYLHLAKSYSAHHTITLGKTIEREVEEERAGMWELSGSEGEYESLSEYKKREKIVSGDEGDEPDDRKRGRSPGAESAKRPIEAEAGDDSTMNIDALGGGEAGKEPDKKRRRRRSPMRGFYDEHTRLPQIRSETQPTTLISYDWAGVTPCIPLSGEKDKLDGQTRLDLQLAFIRAGLATVEYAVEYPPRKRDIVITDEENLLQEV